MVLYDFVFPYTFVKTKIFFFVEDINPQKLRMLMAVEKKISGQMFCNKHYNIYVGHPKIRNICLQQPITTTSCVFVLFLVNFVVGLLELEVCG